MPAPLSAPVPHSESRPPWKMDFLLLSRMVLLCPSTVSGLGNWICVAAVRKPGRLLAGVQQCPWMGLPGLLVLRDARWHSGRWGGPPSRPFPVCTQDALLCGSYCARCPVPGARLCFATISESCRCSVATLLSGPGFPPVPTSRHPFLLAGFVFWVVTLYLGFKAT